ncbi:MULTISPECIES: hypothetical protein [Capnocytophaga]|nr:MULTISPECIES: hypothetical protein [Capnocytophaga]
MKNILLYTLLLTATLSYGQMKRTTISTLMPIMLFTPLSKQQ